MAVMDSFDRDASERGRKDTLRWCELASETEWTLRKDTRESQNTLLSKMVFQNRLCISDFYDFNNDSLKNCL